MKLLKDPRHMLIGFGIAAILSIGALLGVHGYLEYQRQLATTEERLRSEARLLAEHAKLSIAAADFVLTETEAGIQRDGLDALAGDPSRWQMIRQTLLRAPHLDSLMAADADGRVRLTTSEFPAPDAISIADREYFLAHRDGERRYIGIPVVGRSSGRQLIPVSIRLDGPGGEFAGVVVVAMDVTYFQNFYTSEPSELTRRIGMYRSDGRVLSLYPAPPASAMASLQSRVANDFAAHGARSLIGPSPVDGREKIIAFRQIDGYPVVISVATDYSRFIATLYPTGLRATLVFLLFSIGTGAAVYVINRSMRAANRAREAQLELARIQRETERLSYAVIRHMPNGWVAIIDPAMHYVFLDGQGFVAGERLDPAGIIGRTIEEVDPSETGRSLTALVREAFDGVTSERELPYADRIYRATVVPLEDERRQIDHVLLLTQDITELKQAQRELEAHNLQLREISFTDGLLGIANRRAFDQNIAREWRRAMRQQSSVALLMIDVDHFKLFNDTFGHTMGDESLRHLATLLKNTVARPGDMVARYGGEEFTVLLPDSDLDGARHLAEQIHRRLAEAALPFPNAPGSDALTVSIGAAAMRVTPDSSPLTLIQQADRALYTAKKTGRNRTVAAEAST